MPSRDGDLERGADLALALLRDDLGDASVRVTLRRHAHGEPHGGPGSVGRIAMPHEMSHQRSRALHRDVAGAGGQAYSAGTALGARLSRGCRRMVGTHSSAAAASALKVQ